MDATSYTNGAPFLETRRQVLDTGHTVLHFLLPSGARRAVLLDGRLSADELTPHLGAALALQDRRNRPAGPQRSL